MSILKKSLVVASVGAFVASGVTGVVLNTEKSLDQYSTSIQDTSLVPKKADVTSTLLDSSYLTRYPYTEPTSAVQTDGNGWTNGLDFFDLSLSDNQFSNGTYSCISLISELEKSFNFSDITFVSKSPYNYYQPESSNLIISDSAGHIFDNSQVITLKSHIQYYFYYNPVGILNGVGVAGGMTHIYLAYDYSLQSTDNIVTRQCSFGGEPLGIDLSIPDTISNFNISSAQMYAWSQDFNNFDNVQFNDLTNNKKYLLYYQPSNLKFYFLINSYTDNTFISSIILNTSLSFSYSFAYPVILKTNLIPDYIQTTSDYSSGYEAGETAGYDNGYDEGHTDGYGEGYDFGKGVGYSDGFSEGTSSQPSGVFDILGGVFAGMGSFLTIQLFPNITIGMLIGIPLFTAVFFILFKMLKGQ